MHHHPQKHLLLVAFVADGQVFTASRVQPGQYSQGSTARAVQPGQSGPFRCGHAEALRSPARAAHPLAASGCLLAPIRLRTTILSGTNGLFFASVCLFLETIYARTAEGQLPRLCNLGRRAGESSRRAEQESRRAKQESRAGDQSRSRRADRRAEQEQESTRAEQESRAGEQSRRAEQESRRGEQQGRAAEQERRTELLQPGLTVACVHCRSALSRCGVM